MREILFVCTGNTCRSPMAAALLRDELAKLGISDVTVKSAGIAAASGAPASENAVKAMAEEGIDICDHAASPVDGAALDRADAVYAMTEAHRAALAAKYPQYAHKLKVLGGGVDDPFGGGPDIYRRTRDALRQHARQLARDIADEK